MSVLPNRRLRLLSLRIYLSAHLLHRLPTLHLLPLRLLSDVPQLRTHHLNRFDVPQLRTHHLNRLVHLIPLIFRRRNRLPRPVPLPLHPCHRLHRSGDFCLESRGSSLGLHLRILGQPKCTLQLLCPPFGFQASLLGVREPSVDFSRANVFIRHLFPNGMQLPLNLPHTLLHTRPSPLRFPHVLPRRFHIPFKLRNRCREFVHLALSPGSPFLRVPYRLLRLSSTRTGLLRTGLELFHPSRRIVHPLLSLYKSLPRHGLARLGICRTALRGCEGGVQIRTGSSGRSDLTLQFCDPALCGGKV
ncbi:hypothetical protein M427DRAFT_136927 [Gonapodya prolifera JEL478]|uniref:Uncharacterized protein n=1 Tax=Gonapodya prolifera (strain JEL478) TaxID=1344416 RepID=A0A139A8C9_GONPJ|nr:hypothetical protein M427DRAFT_136927 [Gonapodya prolifera JEL478]|eukprot:KXS12987.1 hypothetical protein M427DRAFT_136927 [Gonapodya prolifera JEL478]